MKMFITRKEQENEYSIIKVPDRLVADFERDNKDKICIKGNSIQDAIIQFANMEKGPEYTFNSELVKYKGSQSVQEAEGVERPTEEGKHRISIR